MLQDVVGNGNESVLLAIHSAVLAEESQTVHVGVNYECDIVLALLHELLDFNKVLLQRFGIVLEVTGRLCEQAGNLLHTELLEQLGQDDTTYTVYCIESHLEVCVAYCLNVNEVEIQNHVDVLLVVRVVLGVLAQVIHISILEILSLCNAENLLALLLVEELALLVQKLQGIPHTGVVACSEDDTAVCALHCNCNLGGWSAGQTDVHHIKAHAHQSTADNVLHHLARDTCVATNNNLVGTNG